MVIPGEKAEKGETGEFLNSDMTHNPDFLFRSVHEFQHAHFQVHLETLKFDLKSLILIP